MPYISASELLQRTSKPTATKLDAQTFDYGGIRFHVHGVLHGVTGGTNRQYVELVNHTIACAPGLRLGEKSFMAMYRGLHDELHDWRQVPLRDAFRLGMVIALTPLRIARLLKTAFQEKLTQSDPFLQPGYARLQNLGGSAVFHELDPLERRRLRGFPAPAEYLQLNFARRHGASRVSGPVFPSRGSEWLTDIEPYANIACRSVHMLAYAHAFAQARGFKEVSLFAGDVHGTDMAWYAQHGPLDGRLGVLSADIERGARELARRGGKAPLRKAAYLVALASGMTLPLVVQLLALKWVWAHLAF